MHVANIAVRVLTILLGVFIVTTDGVLFQKVFGVVVILFGVYRLVIYLMRQRKRVIEDEEA
jgi:hypothetical protein